MLDGVEVLIHSSIRINKDKIMYFDPFKINKKYNDADIIFITHDHYDHFSKNDIDLVMKDNTIFVVPYSILNTLLTNGIKIDQIITLNPGDKKQVLGIDVEGIPSYNTNKKFHPQSNNWLGYIINIDNIKYYIAGDTDDNSDIRGVKADVAFVPVGGTFTMDYNEAARFINFINPSIAIPIHYGSVVGNVEDANKFISLLDSNIKGIKLMETDE